MGSNKFPKTRSARSRDLNRRLSFQNLESRQLLAGDLAGELERFDVSGDGDVSALDALMVMNALSEDSIQPLHDVNDDGSVTALDALQIINHVQGRVLAGPEGDPIQSESVSLITPRIVDSISQGFLAKLYDGNVLQTDPAPALLSSRIDPTINFDFGLGTPDARLNFSNSNVFSINWSGIYTPEFSGAATVYAEIGDSDRVQVSINGSQIFDSADEVEPNLASEITLVGDQPIEVDVQYVAGNGPSSIVLGLDSLFTFRGPVASHDVSPLGLTGEISNAKQSGVLAESFAMASLGDVDELRSLPALINNVPASGLTIPSTSFASSTATANGTRLRGLLTPAVSGRYQLQLAGSGPTELWLSSGVDSRAARRVASSDTATALQDFADANAATTGDIYLVAGHAYYVEALAAHDPLQAFDHLSIGWTLPDNGSGTQAAELIASEFVRPVVPVVSLHANVSQTHEDDGFSLGTQTVVHRSDDLGRDLEVGYTIGGTAENGVDYATLSGTITIPAGQTSANIDLASIADTISEDPESVVLRLVSDSRYQLGSEFTRQVTNTIAGEIAGEVQRLPSDPLAIASLVGPNGILRTSGSGTVTGYTVTDTDLPFVAPAIGSDAITVEVTQAGNPWDVALGYQLPATEIADGDYLMASVWARNAGPIDSDTEVTIRLQEPVGFSGNEKTWSLDSDWQLLVFPFQATLSDASADREFEIRLGTMPQTIQLAGLSLLEFASEADYLRSPRTIASYGGRGLDAVWRQAAEQQIDQRNELVEISVVDSAGNPIDGAVVTITPTLPLLPIGTAVEPTLVVPVGEISPTNPLPETLDAQRYRNLLSKYFDSFTDEYALQRSAWETESTRPINLSQWMVDQDALIRGHSVVWGELDSFPAPADLRANYNAILATDGEDDARDWLKNQILDHIGPVEDDSLDGPVEALSGARNDGTPIVNVWDVINHPAFSRDLWDIVGDDFMLEVIDAVRSVVHPDTRLAINEFDILSNPDSLRSDEFFDLLTYLDQPTSGGPADYDTIGFQGHFNSDHIPAIDAIIAELQHFEQFGRDIHVTEFDIDSVFTDPQTQADFTRDFFTALHSNPNVTSATLWGFWAGDHWRETEDRMEGAALFNDDWSLRPNGSWLLDTLADRQQQTTWTTGDVPQTLQVTGQSLNVLLNIDGLEVQSLVSTNSGITQISIDELEIKRIGSGFEIAMQGDQLGTQGQVFLMYSEQPVQERFQGLPAANSDHLVLVRFINGDWHVDNGQSYVPFNPELTDRLVHQIQLSDGAVHDFSGLNRTHRGIRLGYATGDLRIADSNLLDENFSGPLIFNGNRLFFSVADSEGSSVSEIDNVDQAFVVESGNWKTSSSVSGFVGSDYLFASGGNKTARFTPDIPISDTYEVFARWTAHPNRATNARYEIHHAHGASIVSVDQTQGGGVFTSLGTFSFDAGSTGKVTLSTEGTDGFVVSDAVRFEPASSQSIELDNSDPEFAIESGDWKTSSAIAGYLGENYQFASGGDKTVRFTPKFTITDTYEVFARWTEHPNRATNARYDIHHAEGTSTMLVDQTQDGAEFQSLGIFRFNAGNSGSVAVRTFGTSGSVIADSLRFQPAILQDIELDNSGTGFSVLSGDWRVSTSVSGFLGVDYRFAGGGDKSVRFTPDFAISGIYQVFARWTEHPNRATNANYQVTHSDGTLSVMVDQTTGGGEFRSLGTFDFNAGTLGNVTIRTLGSNGTVIADAIRFELVHS